MSDTNWAGNLTYRATHVHRPTSVEHLQDLVVAAQQARAIGSRHSFNAIADTRGVHVDVSGLPDRFDLDEQAQTVTVPAGQRHGELVERLDRAGWALHNLASLPHISVAGAVATGTHGSGDRNGSLASAVAGLQLVTAAGELLDIARGDDDFDAMVVSLGALGIVTYVTLDVQPTFDVRQDVFEHLPWADVIEHFDEITASAYSVSMFTDWGDDITSVWLKSRAGIRSELFRRSSGDRRGCIRCPVSTPAPRPGSWASRDRGGTGCRTSSSPSPRATATSCRPSTSSRARTRPRPSPPCADSPPAFVPCCWCRRSALLRPTRCG
ncbi:FAD-binding protein [Aeromicrobium sp. UC242_57]|uniref:FAD-binding protein n=1 Tax=Aeromicrobium sp. UC242_57 TaxID=3374624 RepID=UPI0037A73FDE